jgi:hypothetical protein
MGQMTATQATKKLEIISDSIIVGVSGPVGLGQRIRGEITGLWENRKFSAKKPYEAMVIIRNALWAHVEPEIKAAQIASAVIPLTAACMSALSETVVALPILRSPCLFQFDQQCAPEEATHNLPFVAIGSGRAIADPFLAFIRRVLWKGQCPSIAQGTFAAVWTLSHAIKTAPGGIGDPIQLMFLERQQGDHWKCRELQSTELHEHQEAVAAAEDWLSQFPEQFHKEVPQTAPPVPEPMAKKRSE